MICLDIGFINYFHRVSGHLLHRVDVGNSDSPPVIVYSCVVFASKGAMNLGIGIGIGTLALVDVSKNVRIDWILCQYILTVFRCKRFAMSANAVFP